jgi:hypothetical protein
MGTAFVVFGFVGNDYRSIFIGSLGPIFLFIAFALWLFKVKKS